MEDLPTPWFPTSTAFIKYQWSWIIYNSQKYSYNNYMSMWDSIKNASNKVVMGVSNAVYAPPETDQFEKSGELSPDEFIRAGDKLTQVCHGWSWKPSSNPKYLSKYLEENKQYLLLTKALCKKRIGTLPTGAEEKAETEEGDEIIVLHAPEKTQEEEEDENKFRYYSMYIIYDEYYHTPRMFFSATDINGKPISNEDIKEDIQKQYLDKTLTMENFPFIESTILPTVHPCKHANVLKSMSDAMRENGQKVESHFALLIFLKFITGVIPTVEFDITGDLHFE